MGVFCRVPLIPIPSWKYFWPITVSPSAQIQSNANPWWARARQVGGKAGAVAKLRRVFRCRPKGQPRPINGGVAPFLFKGVAIRASILYAAPQQWYLILVLAKKNANDRMKARPFLTQRLRLKNGAEWLFCLLLPHFSISLQACSFLRAVVAQTRMRKVVLES